MLVICYPFNLHHKRKKKVQEKRNFGPNAPSMESAVERAKRILSENNEGLLHSVAQLESLCARTYGPEATPSAKEIKAEHAPGHIGELSQLLEAQNYLLARLSQLCGRLEEFA